MVLFDSLSFKFFPHEDSEFNHHDPRIPRTSTTLSRSATREEVRLRVLANGYDVFGTSYDLRHVHTLEVSSVRVYGCLQSLMKMHPLFDLAILKIVELDPQAVVVLSRNSRQMVWLIQFTRRLVGTAESLYGRAHGRHLLQRIVFIDQVHCFSHSYRLSSNPHPCAISHRSHYHDSFNPNLLYLYLPPNPHPYTPPLCHRP